MNLQTQILLRKEAHDHPFQELKVAKRMCRVGLIGSLGLLLIGLVHNNLSAYERSLILASSCFVAWTAYKKYCSLSQKIKKIEVLHLNYLNQEKTT